MWDAHPPFHGPMRGSWDGPPDPGWNQPPPPPVPSVPYFDLPAGIVVPLVPVSIHPWVHHVYIFWKIWVQCIPLCGHPLKCNWSIIPFNAQLKACCLGNVLVEYANSMFG